MGPDCIAAREDVTSWPDAKCARNDHRRRDDPDPENAPQCSLELSVDDLTIEAVSMYNPKPDPQHGAIFHPKGRGNGYVVSLGGTRVYIGGDTGCTPEMQALTDIELAFVP